MTEASSRTDATGHVRVLDGVRAASILLVMSAHTLPIGLPGMTQNEVPARAGMALFFCLSGYLITSMLWHNANVRAFLVKRLARIVPAVFLYLTLLLIFFDLPFQAWLLNLLFVSNYATEALVSWRVSHLWSLCVEVHFYLAIAILVLVAGRRALWLIPPAALVVTGLRIAAGARVDIATHLRVDEILAGGILALVAIHHEAALRRRLADPRLAVVAVGAFTALLAASAIDATGPLMYLRPYFSMALVGTLMHCRLGRLHDILESETASYIAQISYALYIWHKLPVSGVMNTGSLVERYLMKRPVSFVLIWAAAHASTFFWERPWQRWARSYLGQRRLAEA